MPVPSGRRGRGESKGLPQTDVIIRTELLGHGLAQKSADGLSGDAAYDLAENEPDVD